MTMHKPDDRLIITTRDLGLAIRDHLEDNNVAALNADCEEMGSDTVDFVDCSDPHNLTVHMLNGQAFIVRIIAA
jgi:hypothetical protein